MAGTLLRILRRTAFDVSPFGAGAFIDVPLLKGLDVSNALEAVLIVRVHSVNITFGQTGSFQITAWGDPPIPDDPAQDFLSSSNIGIVTVDYTSTAPSVYWQRIKIDSNNPSFGSGLRIKLTQNGGSAASIKATLSADLSLKW